VREEARLVRLAEGLEAGRLRPEAVDRTAAAIRELATVARTAGADVVRASGTAALREAANRDVLIDRVRTETGVQIEVLPADREATLALRGVRSGRPGDGPLAVVDAGGGTVEIVLSFPGREPVAASLPLGVLRLAARFSERDPGLAGHVDGLLPDRIGGLDPAAAEPVGSGGTITTLGALHLGMAPYDGERLRGLRLTRERIAELGDRLAALPLAARRADPVLEPGRADVIVHGARLHERILARYGWPEIEVSPRGVREGLLAEALRDASRTAGAGR
jgi:exopolyphosphatase/guanosine-5'-triphosphate,3'-diphosphate pyrophosphatase